MATWAEIEAEAPELAALARTFFDAFTHKTMATVRRDGSPRISGTEVDFEGEHGLQLGMMSGSRKALDLRRDPRLALHCPTEDAPESDPSSWLGDAKIAGRAVELSDPTRVDQDHSFWIDVTEVVVITVETDVLVIRSWHPGRGLRRRVRS